MVTFMKHVFAAWNYHETNLEYTYKTKRISLHIYIYINMFLDFVSTYVLGQTPMATALVFHPSGSHQVFNV